MLWLTGYYISYYISYIILYILYRMCCRYSHLEISGLQQMEFVVSGSEAEGLYDFLLGAMTQPDLSKPVGPPPPKRHMQVPTTTVLIPSTQEPKATVSGPLIQEPKGVHWNGVPPNQFPNPRRPLYPLKWHLYASSLMTSSRSTAAGLRGAQGDPWSLMPPYAPLCTKPIWAWSYHVPPVPVLFSISMPSDSMASRCIGLGLQTHLKGCLYSYVHKKEFIFVHKKNLYPQTHM